MKKIIIILMVLVSIQTAHAMTESWRACFLDDPCMIGDYVYNDSYVPYTDQICTINITYPNGTAAITDAAMDNNSVGWHNYSFTPPVRGFYPVEIYCSNGIDDGRVEKSFIVWGSNVTGGIFMESNIFIMFTVLAFALGLLSITVIPKGDTRAFTSLLSMILFFGLALWSQDLTTISGGTTVSYGFAGSLWLFGGLGFIMFIYALVNFIFMTVEPMKDPYGAKLSDGAGYGIFREGGLKREKRKQDDD